MTRINSIFKLLIAVLVMLIIATCIDCGGTNRPIKIAVVGPLTGSQAEFGQAVVNGARIAVEEKTRILGRPVELILMDDKADPKEAVSVANKLAVDKDIVAVVGHVNSGTTIPASAVYYKAGLVMITPDATNPKITEQGFDNVFRVCITDAQQGPAAAHFVVEKLNKRSVAVIHDKTAYGQGLAEEFRKTASLLGCRILSFEGITEGDREFSGILLKVKNLNPGVLYFGGMYPEASLLVKQARSLGIKAAFVTGDGSFEAKFVEIGGKATEGTFLTFLALPWEETPAAESFVKAYNQRFGEIKPYAPFSYDATRIILKAIELAGKVDRSALKQVLRSQTFSFEGVVGVTKFDKKGDSINQKPYIYTVKNGKFILYQ